MNVYRREMWANLRSLLFWTLGVLLFIAASMTKYSALSKDPAALGIFTELPMGLQAMFGVGHLDYQKASGFYGMIYPYLTLMGAIHASMLGAVILSKEERDHTAEFIYVKPASRIQILTSKLLAALSMVVIFNLILWGCSVSLVRSFGENADAVIASLMIGLLLTQLLFLALGIACAAVSRSSRAATGIATAVMLSTYILSIAIDVNGNINWLKAFTPFSYFDAKAIVGSGESLSLVNIALCVALTALLTLWAYRRFPRRDIRI